MTIKCDTLSTQDRLCIVKLVTVVFSALFSLRVRKYTMYMHVGCLVLFIVTILAHLIPIVLGALVDVDTICWHIGPYVYMYMYVPKRCK